jgi:ankyrin repeat protein
MIRLARALALPLLLASSSATAQETAQSRLWDAAIAGDTTALVQALADGADVDALDTRTNRNGRRALNWAAWYDHVPVIHVLLRHGAALEARNHTGFTPLHHAAEAGSVDALRALLEAGADPGAKNNAGVRPVETARALGHRTAEEILAAAER